MIQKRNSITLVLIALLFVAACAGNQAMSTKQQGLLMETLYKTTFQEVKAVRENVNATPAQKNLANEQERILVQVHPLLKDFLAPIDPMNPAGDIVGYSMSEAKLAMLFDLIDQLSKLAAKGGAA